MTADLDPVITEVQVPLDPERSFRLFTDDIARWWPLETHAVHGEADMTCALEGRIGGRIYERTPAGVEADWGQVTAWEPPERVAFTWHPGRDDDTATQVEVTFSGTADGTTVRLVHTGWQVLGDRAPEVRERYVTGWGMVLGQRYAAAARAEDARQGRPRRPQSTSVDIDRVIAAGRMLIGSALLLAPARAAKGWLGDSAEDPATQAAVRAIGARDLALGLGVFLAIRRGRSPRGWVEAGIVADATDAIATLIAWKHLPGAGRAATVAMAGGAALTSMLTSIQDRREG